MASSCSTKLASISRIIGVESQNASHHPPCYAIKFYNLTFGSGSWIPLGSALTYFDPRKKPVVDSFIPKKGCIFRVYGDPGAPINSIVFEKTHLNLRASSKESGLISFKI